MFKKQGTVFLEEKAPAAWPQREQSLIIHEKRIKTVISQSGHVHKHQELFVFWGKSACGMATAGTQLDNS